MTGDRAIGTNKDTTSTATMVIAKNKIVRGYELSKICDEHQDSVIAKME